jgi:hypothetical protein
MICICASSTGGFSACAMASWRTRRTETAGIWRQTGEVLVGLEFARRHGLELREVDGTIEAALVDGAGEVVELEPPLLLEVAVGPERRRDLIGSHEEPRVMPRETGRSDSLRVPSTAVARLEFFATTSRAVGGSDARTLRSCAAVKPYSSRLRTSWRPSSTTCRTWSRRPAARTAGVGADAHAGDLFGSSQRERD